MLRKISVFYTLIASLFAALFSSCASTQTAETANGDALNARNSNNWEGVYRGRIPAADGSGIDVEVKLSADQSFTITYLYVDRDGGMIGTGPFVWDETGNIIIYKDKIFPNYYKIGKDCLLHLDIEGNEITGDLAEHYVLKKAE